MKLTDRQIICELARLGEVKADHFKGDGNGYAVGRLIRSGFAEWVRGRLPHSPSATSLRITEAGRQSVAFDAKRAHQDVAGVADVERQIREMGFDAAMANNLAEIVRISAQAGKDESAAEIARLSKALSEAEAERDAAFNKCAELCRESAKIHSAASALEISTSAKLKRVWRADEAKWIEQQIRRFLNAGKE